LKEQIMVRKLSVMVALAAMFVAPFAQADKKKCEAECDEGADVCEEMMLKKVSKDNKAAAAQAKKVCGDAIKQCKAECK
jgi:hypothetical protein